MGWVAFAGGNAVVVQLAERDFFEEPVRAAGASATYFAPSVNTMSGPGAAIQRSLPAAFRDEDMTTLGEVILDESGNPHDFSIQTRVHKLNAFVVKIRPL
jgi:hypothetical protein